MYTLSIKMKCIVLASIRKKVELKTKKMKNLLSLSQFIKKIKSEQVVYTLILSSSKIQEEDDVDESTKKIKDMLIESTYLMSEELPQGLPL